MTLVGGKNRLCACGCETPLDALRSDAVWATDACRKRGYAPLSVEKARNHSSGLQVSFAKAVKALTGPPLFVPEQAAERILAKALSDRQWERLAGRSPRNGVPQ